MLELGGITRSAHHDGNDGEAHLVLKDAVTGATLWSDELAGEGLCFGFNARRGVHIIGSVWESGVSLPLQRILYLDEASRTLHPSAFVRERLKAEAAVASSDGHFIALIALTREHEHGLFLLDVERDIVQRLGEAPLPPSLDASERNFLAAADPEVYATHDWRWGNFLRDSYMPLDPGILTFRGTHTLEVSYGRDSSERRARRRNVIRWDLRQTPAVKLTAGER